MNDLNYYEIIGGIAKQCVDLKIGENERLKRMGEWFETNLSVIAPFTENGRPVDVSPDGLHAIEYDGPVPEGFKKRRDGMIAPKLSTRKGKEVDEAWKGFGTADLTFAREAVGIPVFEIGPKMMGLKPRIEVFGDRVFVVTMKTYEHADLRLVKLWEYEKAKDDEASGEK